MNQNYIEGMKARAKSKPRTSNLSGYELTQWFKGYDVVDSHIDQIIRHASEMLRDMELIGDMMRTDGYQH